MPKLSVITILLAVVALLSCSEKKSTNGADNDARVDSLLLVARQKDAEINDMLSTFNEIQEGLRLISEAEDKVSLLKDDETTSSSEQIKEQLQIIANQMRLNRDLIAKLQRQYRESTAAGEQMKITIATLSQQLAEKETALVALRDELQAKDIQIAELDATVDDLTSNVSALRQENSAQSTTIKSQDKALNTAWYVFGTKKELKEHNILDGNHVLRASFSQSYFTKIDIRVDKEIKLYSKSAKILTSHPAGSYTLSQDANKQYILTISDPAAFWETSRYLVVVVK